MASTKISGAGNTLTKYGAEEIAALMFQHCWKNHQENVTAIAIALAESGGDTNSENHNTNGTVDRGIWQVNSVHNFPGNLFDPRYNILAACSVYKSQGWKAWSTYNNGAYKQFIPQAEKGLEEFHKISGITGPGASREGAEPLLEPFGGAHSEGALEGAAKAVSSWTGDLAKVLEFLLSSSGWLRIGKVVIGSVLLVIAIDELSKIVGGPSVDASSAVKGVI